MTPVEALATPVVDAREIVESYRWGGIELPGWPQRLRASAVALQSATHAGIHAVSGVALDIVADQLLTLAREGLADRPMVLASLSGRLETLVQQTRPAGFPTPGHREISF